MRVARAGPRRAAYAPPRTRAKFIHGQATYGGHVLLEPENMFDGISHVRRRTLPSAEANYLWTTMRLITRYLLAVTPDDIYSDFLADAALRSKYENGN